MSVYKIIGSNFSLLSNLRLNFGCTNVCWSIEGTVLIAGGSKSLASSEFDSSNKELTLVQEVDY